MTEVQVRTEVDSSHTLAVAWRWENVEGVQVIGRMDQGPPTLVIEVAQLDECEGRPRLQSTAESEG